MGSYDFWFEKCRCNLSKSYVLIFHDLLGVILEVYIDDIVIKSAGLDHHLADLRLALERMRRYGLKMIHSNMLLEYRRENSLVSSFMRRA